MVGKALKKSPFPESLDPESCLQTGRPAGRPLCIRIRVNKAWGVRAAVCQECCKPSQAAACSCGAAGAGGGRAGTAPGWGPPGPPGIFPAAAAAPQELPTRSSPITGPVLGVGGRRVPSRHALCTVQGELVSLLAKPRRSHGWKEEPSSELPIALSISLQPALAGMVTCPMATGSHKFSATLLPGSWMGRVELSWRSASQSHRDR